LKLLEQNSCFRLYGSHEGNTSCSIGNLNILGYMHIVSMRTTIVPSKMVIHQCIRKL